MTKNIFSLENVSIRLVKERPLLSDKPIQTPQDAVSIVGAMLQDYDREVAAVIHCSTKGHPISMSVISMGSICAAVVEMREVFKAAILSNAAQIFFLHNHPSGSLVPSKEDIALTERLEKTGKMLGIYLADSIIVGAGNQQGYSIVYRNYFTLSRLEPRKTKQEENLESEHSKAIEPEWER